MCEWCERGLYNALMAHSPGCQGATDFTQRVQHPASEPLIRAGQGGRRAAGGGPRRRSRSGAGSGGERHPELLALFSDALLSRAWPAPQLEELLYHAYGSPWLQALLAALQGQRCALACPFLACLWSAPGHTAVPDVHARRHAGADPPAREALSGQLLTENLSCSLTGVCCLVPCNRHVLLLLIPKLLGAPEGGSGAEEEGAEVRAPREEGALLEGVPAVHVHGMMQERTASHVLEVGSLLRHQA